MEGGDSDERDRCSESEAEGRERKKIVDWEEMVRQAREAPAIV